jgi:hypothetical protein
MPQRVNAFLVLTAGDPHQTTVIAQVMLQGSLDTRLEERGRHNKAREAQPTHNNRRTCAALESTRTV